MNNFFSHLFRHKPEHEATEKMDRAYVSEFTQFIERLRQEHPEIIEDQRIGRAIYWDKKVDLEAQAKAEREIVHEDGYGFYAEAWCKDNHEQAAKRH